MSWVRARFPPMKGHFQRPPGLACVSILLGASTGCLPRPADTGFFSSSLSKLMHSGAELFPETGLANIFCLF